MKKVLFSTTAIAALLIVSSCGKYEEGPGFTVLTKKARLAGQWDLTEYTNGSVTVADTGSDIIEYTKDNTFIYSGSGFSLAGTWEFSDDKASIISSTTILGITSTDTSEILRLTNKELWTKEGSTISKFTKK